MKREKGKFFINAGGVRQGKELGPVVLGISYTAERGRVIRVLFKISEDKRWLVLMIGTNPWTAAYIRKDGWVTDIKVPEKYKGRYEYIFKKPPPPQAKGRSR